jgi:Protein of unknown function (DUF1320)
MTTERTFVPLAGLLTDGQAVQWPRVNYDRLATELDLICYGSVTQSAAVQVQLTLNGVAQAGTYTLLPGLKTGENTIAGGLTIPANVFPGIIVTANAGGSDLAAWLSCDVVQAADQTGPWVTLTAADLQAHISAPEFNAFTSSFLMLGQADPVPQILEGQTNLVRGYVQGNPNNTLGLEGSVPKQLADVALTLAKQHLFQRVGALKSFASAMDEEVKQAMAILRDVSTGKFRISQPVTPAAEKTQGGGRVDYVANDRRNQFERGDLHGL